LPLDRKEIDAAWDSAEHNQRRAEAAEAKVLKLREALEKLQGRCDCNGMSLMARAGVSGDPNKGIHREDCCRKIAGTALADKEEEGGGCR
jgi:hypothetical protein